MIDFTMVWLKDWIFDEIPYQNLGDLVGSEQKQIIHSAVIYDSRFTSNLVRVNVVY